MRFQSSQSQGKISIILLLLLACGVSMLYYAWRLASEPETDGFSDVQERALSPQPTEESGKHFSDRELDLFFDREISPKLDLFGKRNEIAVERAVTRIGNEFESYRQGIPAFVEDITSFRSRCGVVKRTMNDTWEKWWNDNADANQVLQYTYDKFEKHVFSNKDLADLLQSTLDQFKDDIKANQNELHSEVMQAWKSQGMNTAHMDLDAIERQVDQHLKRSIQHMGPDSVLVEILSLFGGNIATDSLIMLINLLLEQVRYGVAASILAGAEGSTTEMFLMAGASAGAVTANPLIGVGVGLAAGLMVDFLMTKNFENQLTTELESLPAVTETMIVTGGKKTVGVRQLMNRAMKELGGNEKSALYAALKEQVQ